MKKVVIWGFPLYSHTHSYIHAGWFKAFKHLGFDTYWFSDNDYPVDFDYSNCIFIGHGCDHDKHIPINNTSIYFIHLCTEPQKYLECGARLIEILHNAKSWKDYSHNYILNPSSYEQIDSVTYYQRDAFDTVLQPNFQKGISGYEAIYLCWATDTLPDEFNFEDRFRPRTNDIHYVGSLWSANNKEIETFANECFKNGVSFFLNDPWKQPTTFEHNKKLIQQSYMAPDIRGRGATSGEVSAKENNHIDNGYVPCRVFKNVSYGQIGITNSWAVNDVFCGRVVYNSNVAQLFYDGRAQLTNFDLIKEQMEFVKENHTFVNRVNALLSLL